jgi:hypothetical protein
MKRLILVFILLTHYSAIAQLITGKVRDASNKSPLPYVHIGVLDRNMGVISHDDGSFSIDLSNAKPDDQLLFSMIGYETFRVQISQIKSSNLDVSLKPKVYELKEVVVRGKRKSKKDFIKLGRYNSTTTTRGRSSREEFGYGGEWGLKILNNGKKYKVLDARFHLRFNTVDSALFRIQLYSINNELPAESLLKKETFVTSKSGQHWIICDLENQDITLDQDVILTYETVRVWFKKDGVNELFYTFGSGYIEGQTYSRMSSHDQWKVNDKDTPPVALYLTVEEIKEQPK